MFALAITCVRTFTHQLCKRICDVFSSNELRSSSYLAQPNFLNLNYFSSTTTNTVYEEFCATGCIIETSVHGSDGDDEWCLSPPSKI